MNLQLVYQGLFQESGIIFGLSLFKKSINLYLEKPLRPTQWSTETLKTAR